MGEINQVNFIEKVKESINELWKLHAGEPTEPMAPEGKYIPSAFEYIQHDIAYLPKVKQQELYEWMYNKLGLRIYKGD